MKNILILFAFIFVSCVSQKNQGSLLADGKIIFEDCPVEYIVIVDNGQKWIEWEPWKIQNNYSLVAYKGDTLKAIWINIENFDTLAVLTVINNNDYIKKRYIQKDIVLNGNKYLLK